MRLGVVTVGPAVMQLCWMISCPQSSSFCPKAVGLVQRPMAPGCHIKHANSSCVWGSHGCQGDWVFLDTHIANKGNGGVGGDGKAPLSLPSPSPGMWSRLSLAIRRGPGATMAGRHREEAAAGRARKRTVTFIAVFLLSTGKGAMNHTPPPAHSPRRWRPPAAGLKSWQTQKSQVLGDSLALPRVTEPHSLLRPSWLHAPERNRFRARGEGAERVFL